jgi:DNA adenine methylase
MKAPIRYFGSKWRLAPWIVQQLPPHVCYVEPFGGSAAVLLTKPPSPNEVYNDINSGLVSFFRVLRERPHELAEAVALTPYSREEHALSYEPSTDDLEVARRFAVQSWQTIGGIKAAVQGRGWRYSIASISWATAPQVWSRVPQRLLEAADRLKMVMIDHDDWRTVLQRYDSPTTLFYLDPPYLSSTRVGGSRATYQHELEDADHEDLLRAALEVSGMVVISGYPSEQYDNALHGWTRLEVAGRSQSNAATTEVLWLSPAAMSSRALPLFR